MNRTLSKVFLIADRKSTIEFSKIVLNHVLRGLAHFWILVHFEQKRLKSPLGLKKYFFLFADRIENAMNIHFSNEISQYTV